MLTLTLYNLKILNLESIYKLQIGKFMYQDRSGLLPYSFKNMFLASHQVDSYGTRSSELFYLPQCRTNLRKFSIIVTWVVFQRTGSLQAKLNAGLLEQQQDDLFQK